MIASTLRLMVNNKSAADKRPIPFRRHRSDQPSLRRPRRSPRRRLHPTPPKLATPPPKTALQSQSAYQILAATTPELLAQEKPDLWDSAKVTSDETLQIPYAGKPLASSQTVYWKVRAWDQSGNPSPWSPTATWAMGVLSISDWAARWIGAPASPSSSPSATLMLRKSLIMRPGVKRAFLHICGLGQYEAIINGHRVGENLLAPGWSLYNSTCLYDLLRRYLSPHRRRQRHRRPPRQRHVQRHPPSPDRYTKFTGTFGPLKMIAQLHVDFADGESVSVGSDGTWCVTAGPITFSSVYGGEDYDARLEPADWTTADYDDAKWLTAAGLDGPGGKLKGLSCSAPPIRGTLIFSKPVKVNQFARILKIYDLGQNASVMPRITVQGQAGSSIYITPAELLGPDGRVDRASSGGGRAYWSYTLKGTGEETYFPKFFYHGCRYLEVECRGLVDRDAEGPFPTITSLEGVVVHSISDPVGEFSCSNDLFNRTRTLNRWAQRAAI